VVALAVAGASPLQSLRAQELSPSLSDLQYTGNFDVRRPSLARRADRRIDQEAGEETADNDPNEAAENDAWYSAFGVRPGDKLFLPEKNRVLVW
jgi:hypothetical protein